MAVDFAARRQDSTRSTYARWLRFRELGIIAVLAVVTFGAALVEPRFLSVDNLKSIVLYVPLIIVVAMGQMMIIVSRYIDLSVGSTLGLSGMIVGMLFIQYPQFPLSLAFPLAMLIGAVLGAINGVLVGWVKLPAIIATLGTLSVYRGLTFVVSGGRQVDPNYIPEPLIRLSQWHPLFGIGGLNIPWILIIAGLVVALAGWFLRYTHTGREIFALGSNPKAAELRGIDVKRVTMVVFVITGALSGLAGLLYASRFGYINPAQTGVGFELLVITAVVLGGVSVMGGSGTVTGTVLGCLLLGVINVALIVLGVSAFWQRAIYGVGILLSISIDMLIQRGMRRAMMGGKRA